MPANRLIALLHVIVFLATFAVVTPVATTSFANFAEGEALFEAEKYGEAKKVFEKLSKDNPQGSRSFYYLGRIARVDDKTDDAIKYFKKAIEIEETSDYYVWLGETYVAKLDEVNFLKKKGVASKMKKAFIRAVELDPNNPDARSALAQFYMEAPGFAGGDKDKSREQIEVLKTLDPKEGARVSTSLYVKDEEFELAEQELLVELDGSDEDASVYYSIGRVYQDAKKYEKAVEQFEQALEIDPDHGNSIYQIGRTSVFWKQNLDRAVECMQLYLQRDPQEHEPSWANAHWRLGMLYEIRKETDLAKAEYQAAVKLDPDNKEAKKALKHLKRR